MSNTYNYHHPIHSKQTYHSNRRGFTIVELLIVIVVIAILAAISVVAYNGIQNRANDTIVQNDIMNAGKQLELYFVDHDAYPTTASELFAILGSVNVTSYATHANTLTYCNDVTLNKVAIGGVSTSGKGFVYKDGSIKQVDNGWSQGGIYAICNDIFGLPVPIGSVGAWRYPSSSAWNINLR